MLDAIEKIFRNIISSGPRPLFAIGLVCLLLWILPESWTSSIGIDVYKNYRGWIGISAICCFGFIIGTFIYDILVKLKNKVALWRENQRKLKVLNSLQDKELEFLCEQFLERKQFVSVGYREIYFSPIVLQTLTEKGTIKREYNSEGLLFFRIDSLVYDYLSTVCKSSEKKYEKS
jgi:hypothetical protein